LQRLLRDRLSASRHQQRAGHAADQGPDWPGHDRANQGAGRAGGEFLVCTLLAAVNSCTAGLYGSSFHNGLQTAAAADQIHQDHDDRDHQQDMNEAANGVGCNQTEQPQNQ
jgi:hypothetical protein